MGQSSLSKKDYVKDVVLEALSKFYQYDRDLLDWSSDTANIYEPCISARIAMHLYSIICSQEDQGYRVDCEYNKAGEDLKIGPTDRNIKSMRPDIVIHKRSLMGSNYNDDNILYCELKKHDISVRDRRKMNFALEHYNYLLALSIHTMECEKVTMRWVEKGQDAFDTSLDTTYYWDGKILEQTPKKQEK